jgi:hypothetical protein
LFLCFALTVTVHAQTQCPSDALHEPFSELLMGHIADGHVNYTGIKADPRFSLYLNALKSSKPTDMVSDAEKLAFWINAYNALAIKGIIDGLSPSSLLGRFSYFKSSDYEVGGQVISLHDLERDIIIINLILKFRLKQATHSVKEQAELRSKKNEEREDNI